MAPRYAADTSVSPEKSRNEIEQTLRRYGATSFAYGWEGTNAMIAFEANDRRIRFVLPLPSQTDKRFTQSPTGRKRSVPQSMAAWDQACRSSWRALALVIKAKLEAVEVGIVSFEDEFAANILLPNGMSVGDWLRPQIQRAYELDAMPPMLALTA
jgi:hypothetical protein